MNLFQTLILSIVEGVTEFLPVSSTGHLVLTSHLLSIPQTEFVKSFQIIIQLGAILAVVLLYWDRFFLLKKEKNIKFDEDYFQNNLQFNYVVWGKVLAAFIPTAIIGFVLYKFIKGFLLGNELVTVLALFIGGVLLVVLEKGYFKRKEGKEGLEGIEKLSVGQCMGIGLVQAVSVIPGVSRSAASIFGGMFLGASRKTAVEFSFLLAIPTMIAATGLDLLETNFAFSFSEWMTLGIGFIASFFVALVVVKWFIKYVQTNSFIAFGIYRIIAAVLYYIIVMR